MSEPTDPSAAEAALAETVRTQWARLAALLLARTGRLDLVEDALGDAVETAARRWPTEGVPDSPAAWLMTVARRRTVDRLRAEHTALAHDPELRRRAEAAAPLPMADPGDLVEDDLLRLVLMCCHPCLDVAAASALSLRLVLGVPTAQVARLFLVPEATMAARITRAKRRVARAAREGTAPDARNIPGVAELAGRLDAVAQAAYLGFTAGYSPGTGPDLLRIDVADQAVRLVRTVHGLRPDEPVLLALLALVLLQHSRRDARVEHGRLVLLPDQDRARWHRDEIAEARALLAHPALTGPMSRPAAGYLLQARIALEHASPARADLTRWDRIVALHDALLDLAPSPAAHLARAVAVAEAEGPAAALAALEVAPLPESHRTDAVLADLLRRAGRTDAARAAYDRAIARCANQVELDHLRERRASLP